jgi:hypothetical protein
MNALNMEWCEVRVEVRELFINAMLQHIDGTIEGARAADTWALILQRETAESTDWENRRSVPGEDAGTRLVERARELCAQMVERKSD